MARRVITAKSINSLASAARVKQAKAMGQDDLFGAAPEQPPAATIVRPDVKAWTLVEMLAAEKKALGFYITAHPLDDYSETISKLGASASNELGSQRDGLAGAGGRVD